MEKLKHIENHEVKLKFNSSDDMHRALNKLSSEFDVKTVAVSDYDIWRWENGTEEDEKAN